MEKRVKSLHVYPVKSFHGVNLKTSSLTPGGLTYDRNWMLTDAEGKFMTQRKYPQMALFKVTILDNSLEVKYNGDRHFIPFQVEGKQVSSKVWRQKVLGREVSPEVSDWFSEKFGMKVKLLHFDSLRKVRNAGQAKIPFSDSSPFHLVGESSVADLNERMQENLSALRFRPNFVISGLEPYEEDTWKQVAIGNCKFEIFKKSFRCQLPNVDPEAGLVDKNVLKFLASYRRDEKKRIKFGVHLYLLEGNEINVGDKVEILSFDR